RGQRLDIKLASLEPDFIKETSKTFETILTEKNSDHENGPTRGGASSWCSGLTLLSWGISFVFPPFFETDGEVVFLEAKLTRITAR
ncbi:hypothetical protein BgiMline_017024, partial [Biomphalaria glabrata]